MNGMGASMQGGRWNSPGLGPIYAAENYSGAYLELMVKLGRVALSGMYHYCEIVVPDDVPVEDSNFPLAEIERESVTRRCGNSWWKGLRTAVLRVPSALTHVDSNFLLNPFHPQFHILQVSATRPVWVDPRLTLAAQGWKAGAR